MANSALLGIGTSVGEAPAKLPDLDAVTIFFEHLRVSQYRLDPRQLAATHRILLTAHAERWTIERLRFVFMILLAKTRREQIDFTSHFDRWMGIGKESKETGLATRIARLTRPWLIVPFVFAAVGATLLVERIWVTGAPYILIPAGGMGEAVGALGLSDLVRAAAVVPLALFAVFVFLRWRRRTLWVDARAKGQTIEFDQIDLVPALGSAFGGPALYDVARELRRHRPVPTLELDIERTVEATARHAGHFSAVWRRRMRRPEYVVLIEENSYRDHIARILDVAIDALKKLEVGIQRFYYNSDPRVVVADDHSRTPVSLASLAERERNARLIIFGSGRGLVHPLTERLGARLRQTLHPWTERIFLSTEPVEAWGQREHQLLYDGFTIGTASMAGLIAVATHVAQGSRQGGGLLETRLKISYAEPVSSESKASPRKAAASPKTVTDMRAGEVWQRPRVLHASALSIKSVATRIGALIGHPTHFLSGLGLYLLLCMTYVFLAPTLAPWLPFEWPLPWWRSGLALSLAAATLSFIVPLSIAIHVYSLQPLNYAQLAMVIAAQILWALSVNILNSSYYVWASQSGALSGNILSFATIAIWVEIGISSLPASTALLVWIATARAGSRWFSYSALCLAAALSFFVSQFLYEVSSGSLRGYYWHQMFLGAFLAYSYLFAGYATGRPVHLPRATENIARGSRSSAGTREQTSAPT